MTAVPGTSAVTRPVCDTATAVALLVVHTTARPGIAVPRLSYAVATRLVPAATTRSTLSGSIFTDATFAGAGTTVTLAIPDFPSTVAATFTCPALTPVTTPLSETVAMPGFALAHTTRRSRRTVPPTPVTSASSTPVAPAPTSSVGGVTTTDSTGEGSSVSVTPHALANNTAWTSGILRQNKRMNGLP